MLTLSSGASAETLREVSGRATLLDSGERVYSVTAQETWVGGRQTRFSARHVDGKGRLRMTREVVYHDDRFVPDERLEHPLTGKMSQTKRLAKGVRLSARDKAGARVRSAVVSPPRPYVSGFALSAFLSSHRGALAKGETVRFVMLAPSRLDWYRFRARKSADRGVKPGQFLVAIDTDSMVLRLFVSTMYFWFDAQTGGLIRYEGPVSVEDDGGDMLNVRVDFPQGLGVAP